MKMKKKLKTMMNIMITNIFFIKILSYIINKMARQNRSRRRTQRRTRSRSQSRTRSRTQRRTMRGGFIRAGTRK